MTSPAEDRAAPRPHLSTLDAVMIIVGIVIGGGIFALPSTIAGLAGSPGWMWAAWAGGAALTLAGALCYAEMAAAFPHAGGDYHFLTRAYGRDVSFFFGWARVSVILTGSIAMLAFVCGDYLARVAGLGAHSPAIYAALVIVALTVVNALGLRESARMQNVLTAVEVARRAARDRRRLHDRGPRAGRGARRGGGRRRHAGDVRARPGLRAVHLRRLERGGLHLGRGPRAGSARSCGSS